MATIRSEFKKINDELQKKYNVRLLGEDIPRSSILTGKRKRLLISLIAVKRAKKKLERAEETREEMIKNVNNLKKSLLSDEEVNNMVEDISSQKEKIAGDVSQALNYLGKINSTTKVPIGSASLLIGPWQHWRGFKIRHGGWFKKLLVPVPIVKSIVKRAKSKRMVSYNIGDVVKYDENAGDLKISNDVIDSLSPEKIANTALNGNKDIKYEKNEPDSIISFDSKDLNDDEKTESYMDTPELEKEELNVVTSPESENKEEKSTSVAAEEPTKKESSNAVITDISDLIKSYDKEESEKIIEQHALSGQKSDAEINITEEPIKMEESKSDPIVKPIKNETPIVEPFESKKKEKGESSTDELFELMERFTSQLKKEITSMREKLDILEEDNKRKQEENNNLRKENEALKTQIASIQKENVKKNTVVKPISWSDISDGTNIYHADGSYTTKETPKEVEQPSRWRLQNNDYEPSVSMKKTM